MTTMDQLFKALPRDLQWEVLTEFTGTHVVRYGKLMRKIAFNHVLPVKRARHHLLWLYDRQLEDKRPQYIRFTTLVSKPVQFCYDGHSGDTIFCYRKIVDYHTLWEVQYPLPRAEDAITLPPFVKHIYPSYPYTEKKRRIPLIR
jgi:hypothetical protein